MITPKSFHDVTTPTENFDVTIVSNLLQIAIFTTCFFHTNVPTFTVLYGRADTMKWLLVERVYEVDRRYLRSPGSPSI